MLKESFYKINCKSNLISLDYLPCRRAPRLVQRREGSVLVFHDSVQVHRIPVTQDKKGNCSTAAGFKHVVAVTISYTAKLSTDKIFTKLSTDKIFTKLSTDKIFTKLSTDKIFTKLSTDKIFTKLSTDKIFTKLSTD